MKKLLNRNVWLQYSILFLCISIVVFMPFVIFRKTLISNTDGYLQWYAILAKVKNIALDFLNGNGFSFWSWDTGLGSDLIGNYAAVLFDPFSYLTIFFKNRDLDIAYSIIVVLKMYFAGMAFLGYVKYHKKSNWICLLCAIGYAFCAWSVGGLRHDSFMNQLILFPLLIWGVDRVDDKKSPIVLIFSVMFSLIISLYFSYMSAIFVVVYIILKYCLCSNEKSIKIFFCRLLKFVIYAILGGVLASPVICPALFTLLQAPTGSGVNIQLLPNLKQLLRFIPAFASTCDVTGFDSALGTNMLFVSMLPAMLLLWKKKRISSYMFFLSALFVLLPAVQSILNGFSYASSRWCYVFCFFYAFAVSDCIEIDVLGTDKYKKYAGIWFGIILFASFVAGILFKAISLVDLLLVLLNIIFGVFIVRIVSDNKIASGQQSKLNKRFVFYSTVINIIIIQVIVFHPRFGNKLSFYMTHGVCHEIYESTALKAAADIDDEFCRVDMVDHLNNNGVAPRINGTPANSNIYWSVPSVFEYLSTIDKNWIKFNQILCNNSGSCRRVCIHSNDNRPRMDFLLGVGYFLSNDSISPQSVYAGYGFKEVKEENNIKIYQSPYKVGLGYVYDRTISENDFMGYTPLEKEQILMQCAVIQDEDSESISVKKGDLAALNIGTNTVPVSLYDGTGTNIQQKSFTISRAGQAIKLKTDKEILDSEVYVVFKKIKKELQTPQEIWELQKSNMTDSQLINERINKYNFFSDYLSYTPYQNFSISVSDIAKNITKRIVNSEGDAQAIRDNEDYVVNLGYYDRFGGEISCSFAAIGEYYFDDIEVVSVPIENYKEQAAVLSQKCMKVERNQGDYLKGSVVSEEDNSLLYLSILYNPGWSVYVDGVKNDNVYRVNTAFMGVELPAGEHEIELLYHPVGMPYTIVLFFIGIILTVLIGARFLHVKN